VTTTSDIAQAVRQKAIELGFSACGFSPAERLDALEPFLDGWVASGMHGEMGYLARNTDVRVDPGRLVDGAKTVISLAASYYHTLAESPEEGARISRYALGEDYHVVLKKRGRELLSWISSTYGPASGRVFTDSAPIPEREWARRAGLGWIGKNGCLISKQGSWFFLAEVIVDIAIPEMAVPAADRCGTCSRCTQACPTQALAGDGSIDPGRCISYLTIEHRSPIPEEFRGLWKQWVFGCDICQDVCPWNSKAGESPIAEFAPRPGLQESLAEPAFLQDEEQFVRLFGETPLMRAGREQIMRNFTFVGLNPGK
jgi:epoxyqueuosine reductase